MLFISTISSNKYSDNEFQVSNVFFTQFSSF